MELERFLLSLMGLAALLLAASLLSLWRSRRASRRRFQLELTPSPLAPLPRVSANPVREFPREGSAEYNRRTNHGWF